jgi:hypothetical protein
VSTLAVAPSLFDPPGGEQTLDDLLARAWEELQAHRVVECPVCHGEMEPDRGAQGRPIGGRCSACGSTVR